MSGVGQVFDLAGRVGDPLYGSVLGKIPDRFFGVSFSAVRETNFPSGRPMRPGVFPWFF